MQISTSKGLIGIADPRWPESASVERLAMDSGFEAIVSTEVAGLLAKKDQLALVVTKLEKHGSLQDIIAIMKAFGHSIAKGLHHRDYEGLWRCCVLCDSGGCIRHADRDHPGTDSWCARGLRS